jgi:hypothetical protein
MSAPINVYLHGGNIRSRKQFLKVGQHFDCDFPRTRFGEQVCALSFTHRGVAGEDVGLLLVARLLLCHPVGHNEIREGVPRTPSVVSLVEDWLVEDEVNYGVRYVAHLAHGLALFFRESFYNAASDEFRGGHDHHLRRHRLQFVTLHVGHLDAVSSRNHGNGSGAIVHAVSKFRVKSF